MTVANFLSIQIIMNFVVKPYTVEFVKKLDKGNTSLCQKIDLYVSLHICRATKLGV